MFESLCMFFRMSHITMGVADDVISGVTDHKKVETQKVTMK